jgi:putative MFS transporter
MRDRRQILDLAPVTIGGLLVLGAAFFQLHLWPRVAAHLPEAPDAFAAACAALNAHSQLVLFPLGVLTSIATCVVLLRQGTGSPRGRLHVVAVGALGISAVISTAAIDPLARAIADSAANAEAIAALVRRMSILRWVNFGLVLTVGMSLVVAYRLPAPAAAFDAGGMASRHRRILFLLGAATLFDGYDRFIVSLALPYIGKDLGASESELGYALSFIRLGALLSIVLGEIADRYGRRRLLLVTVLAYTLATVATGMSAGLATFILFQLIATVFLVAELTLAQVIIAEEFPPAMRGRGQGMLGAFSALGSGLAAVLFPILQKTPLGWRGLYLIGVLPLLFIAYLWRALPETQRWERARGAGASYRPRVLDVLRPGLRLRFSVLIAVAATASLVGGSAFGFASYRATNTFGWTPAQVSATILTGGGLGLLGWIVFGRLVDTFGRRLIGMITLLGAVGAVLVFYRTAWLLPAFGAMVFLEAGAAIAINSLGTELFPTALRATAKAWITNAGLLGAMLGLALVGATSERLGGVDEVITLLAIVPMVAAPLLLLLPETSGRELEAIEAD